MAKLADGFRMKAYTGSDSSTGNNDNAPASAGTGKDGDRPAGMTNAEWRAFKKDKSPTPLIEDSSRDDETVTDLQTTLLDFVKPSDWHDSDVPRRDWFWEGLVPDYQVSILTAEGGTGKSLIAAQAGAAASLYRSTFLGRKIKGGPVVYLGAEDDMDEFKRRLHDIARSEGVRRSELQDFNLIEMAAGDPVLSEPDRKGVMQPTVTWDRLVATVQHLAPVALFLDTAADLFGGDEIKRGQVRRFVGMLRTLAVTEDLAVVLLYHPSRSGIENGKGESGSTAWFNSVRAAVYMTDEKGDDTGRLRRIRNTKSNYGGRDKGFVVRWDDGVFWLHDENAPPTPEQLAKWQAVDLEFMGRFVEFTSSSRNEALVPGKTSQNYGPKKLRAMKPTDYTAKDYDESLERLLDDKLSIVEEKKRNGGERKVLSLYRAQDEYRPKYGVDD